MNFRLALLLLLSIALNPLLAQITEMSPMPERVTNNAVVEGFVSGVPYVYSFAGLDSTKNYNGIHLRSFRYNTQTDVWESIAPLPDTLGKIATSANRIDDIIYSLCRSTGFWPALTRILKTVMRPAGKTTARIKGIILLNFSTLSICSIKFGFQILG